jgi:pyruvate dehydrogenase E1 component
MRCVRNDKVAVKPHAGPVLHAIHYLLGNQSPRSAPALSAVSAARKAIPSRTKDKIPVDFSTGSVGLGVGGDRLFQPGAGLSDRARQAGAGPRMPGRMIALMGDAELDEGNIYECLIEGYKHDIRNCWWIVDYNRQSLDHTTADRMFRRFDDIFETCGWRVVTLKYGKLQKAAFTARAARRSKNGSMRAPMPNMRHSPIRAARHLARAADARHRRHEPGRRAARQLRRRRRSRS